MREILFRGKRLDNGEWIEGGYFAWVNLIGEYQPLILVKTESGFSYNQVFPETVCQFTGLTDKKGVKIFEGDIVKGRHWTSGNDKSPEEYHIWRVNWSEKSGLITFIDSPTTAIKMSIHDFRDFGEAEVIGNIFDNPELMEGGGSDE